MNEPLDKKLADDVRSFFGLEEGMNIPTEVILDKIAAIVHSSDRDLYNYFATKVLPNIVRSKRNGWFESARNSFSQYNSSAYSDPVMEGVAMMQASFKANGKQPWKGDPERFKYRAIAPQLAAVVCRWYIPRLTSSQKSVLSAMQFVSDNNLSLEAMAGSVLNNHIAAFGLSFGGRGQSELTRANSNLRLTIESAYNQLISRPLYRIAPVSSFSPNPFGGIPEEIEPGVAIPGMKGSVGRLYELPFFEEVFVVKVPYDQASINWQFETGIVPELEKHGLDGIVAATVRKIRGTDDYCTVMPRIKGIDLEKLDTKVPGGFYLEAGTYSLVMRTIESAGAKDFSAFDPKPGNVMVSKLGNHKGLPVYGLPVFIDPQVWTYKRGDILITWAFIDAFSKETDSPQDDPLQAAKHIKIKTPQDAEAYTALELGQLKRLIERTEIRGYH